MESPKRRVVLAVCATLLLLVTAGCSGGTNPTSTTAPTTATPTTTATGTWSPNASVEQYPPGVADNGTLTNSTVLADAHFAATANESLVLTVEGTGPNHTDVRTYAHGDSPTPFYAAIDRTEDGTRTVSESHQTAERGFVRHEVENRTLYRVTQNTTVPGTNDWLTDGVFGAEYSLSSHLSLGNYSVNGTVERDGRTFVELTADERAPNMDIVSAYDGTALVTPDGVVHSVEASYDWGTGDDREFREVSVSLDTDVEWTGAPPWVDDRPHLSVSIVKDGRALELRNTGGATLPANATFDVSGMNSTEGWEARIFPDVNGTVTTDAALEPGEAVYVTADENGSSFTLHDDPARGEYTFAAAKLHSRTKSSADSHTIYSLVTGLDHQPE